MQIVANRINIEIEDTGPGLNASGQERPVVVPFAHGQDTAQRIPKAQFVPIDGMAHDLPPGVVERVLGAMVPHFKAV